MQIVIKKIEKCYLPKTNEKTCIPIPIVFRNVKNDDNNS